MQKTLITAIALAASTALLAVAGCGGDDAGESSDGPVSEAPPATEFPKADGRTLEEILATATPNEELVLAPAGAVFNEGESRFAFGVFTVDRTQVSDAEVAIYAAPSSGGPATGPYPARVESLGTDAAFVAQSTAADPDSAKSVYVTDIDFSEAGAWDLIGLIREGDSYSAARIPSVNVGRFEDVPQAGDEAPSVHTPTLEDVADVSEIDTREPPTTQHEDDLADVLGEEPVVLTFATPRLCASRVCGPVADIAEQVKSEYEDQAAFIHMEIYNDNEVDKGQRPQVQAYNLPTEPWVFVIDNNGEISETFEGAVSLSELEAAVEKVV